MMKIIEDHFKNGFFSNDEYNLIIELIKLEQEQLFSSWDPIGINDDKKKNMLNTLINIDNAYPGGIAGYLTKAKQLLHGAKEGINPHQGFKPTSPQTVDLSKLDMDFQQIETEGLANAHRLSIALVAGGLGERLGYGGIKINIPFESSRQTTFIQHYIESILALQHRINSNSNTGDRPITIPFIIMTSEHTHSQTISCLETNNHFGLDKDQIMIIKQQLVPALSDNQAGIALEKAYTILLKPHGHGDIHFLMKQENVINRLLEQGKEYIVFIQDTNAHIFNAILPSLAISLQNRYDFNFLAVPRVAQEAVGAISRLIGQEQEITMNIEYNQLDALLKQTVDPKGDVGGEDGKSPFPGNTNALLVKLSTYNDLLNKQEGRVPEFINPKYTDQTRSAFKKPVRVESLMQDLARLYVDKNSVGVTIFDRKWCFSPLKNSISSAGKNYEHNIPCESATSAESDYYLINRKKLSFGKMDFEKGEVIYFHKVPFLREARIYLHPGFCLTIADINEKVSGGYLSKDATLIINGENVFIENLVMKGNSGLVLNVCSGAGLKIKDLTVDNDGFEIIALTNEEMADAGVPEFLKIRGYRINSRKPLIYNLTEPGDYELGADGKLILKQSRNPA